MRKSSRETKKPELFSFPDGSSHTVDSDAEDEPAANSQSIVKPVIRKPKDTSLFDTIKGGANKGDIIEIVSANRSLGQDVARWINSYKVNKVAAMVELVNFVLMSAGAKKKWIASDVDLEALEAEELDILLSAMMKNMSQSDDYKQYPLSEKAKSKAAHTYRDKYQGYWAIWVEKVLSLPRDGATAGSSSSSSNRRADGHDILLTVINQLVALSSIAVVNVRDAVTEAVLSVARGVLESCTALKAEAETARRQIAAEETLKSKSAAKLNPKYQSCVQQETRAKKDFTTQWQMTENVFNSVFVHRSNDYNEEVRVTVMRHLLDFVRVDPVHPIRVDALKYLGRGCGDYAAPVRLESIKAIHALVQIPEAIPYLATFVQHFSDRFIQIASSDIDDKVALAMIEAMRAMQRNCLLDSLPQDKLDGVDVIVFDPEASLRVRQEALAFIMDHTEGFEDDAAADGLEGALDQLNLDPGTNNNSSSSKGKKSKAGAKGAQNKTDQAKALARRQRTAQQLETLTEFAEMHLGSLVERSYMLTEACLSLKKFGMLYNWSTIIALLLRESDELISSALRPQQAAVLLRMFVHAAIDLTAKRRKLSEAISLSATDKQLLECWEALNENLHAHLPTLLTRFKDNEDNLIELVDLLPCCEFTTEERALKALLKVVMELFGSTRQESILSSLVVTVCGWMRTGGTIAGTVESAVKGLVVSSWGSILENTVLLQGLVSRRDSESASASEATSRKGSKRKSGGSLGPSQTEKEDVLLALQSSLTPFKLFWSNLDCRSYFELSTSQIADELTELTELVPTFSDGETLTDALCDACIASASAAAAVIHSAVLWSYKDVLDLGRDMVAKQQQAALKASKAKSSKKGASSSSQETMDESETPDAAAPKADARLERSISIAVDSVVALREKLIDILLTWIAAETPSTGDSQSSGSGGGLYSSSAARVTRALQLEAFRLVSDLRNFFPIRESQYKYIDRLAYRPNEMIVVGLRNVFEREGGRIKQELLSLNQDDPEGERAARELSRTLIEGLLDPLSNSLTYDVENLNRKQAASVIYYLLDSNTLIEDRVKSFMRRLKEANPVKYLEIQLIAMRNLFQEVVAKPLDARALAEETGDEDFDYAESDRTVSDGFARVELLARKLSQSMGIAKFKDASLVGLVNFFSASIDFSVQHLASVGFVGCLGNYIKFLPPQSQREVAVHLETVLEAKPDLADDLEAQRARDAEQSFHGHSAGLSRFLEFVDQLMGRGRPKVSRRKSNTGAKNDSSLDIGVDVAGKKVPTAGKQQQQKQHQLAMSSQVLQEEDMAMISGNRYHQESIAASQRGANRRSGAGKAKEVQPKKAPAMKKAKKAPAAPVQGARQSARSSSLGRGSQSYAEADSSGGEEDEEEGGESEDDIEESEENDNEEAEQYVGISQIPGRGRNQPFNSRTASQTQTQTQTQTQRQSQGGTQRATQRSSSSSAAATARPSIVLGLDIEDIDEEESEPSGGRRGSRKRPYSSVRSSTASVGSAAADQSVADSFAELDSIPSRRRLR